MTEMYIPKEVIRIRDYIKSMKIRGAGTIARAGAKALAIAAEKYVGNELSKFMKYMECIANYIRSARPTAVSLPNAIMYVMNRLRKSDAKSVEEARRIVIESANEFIDYSLKAIKIIGELGARRIEHGDVIMTHCHSTAALSVIITAYRQGKVSKVFVKETRPKMQGLITAKVLANEGLDVILIPDSAVRYYMRRADKVVVGADTIAANGAVVNKIGTSMVALAAKEARVRVYVAAESYKFSPLTLIGELVPIEIRNPTEIVSSEWLRENPGVEVFNPVFDVTPPEYIDAIITERGIIPPQAAILILMEEYGLSIKEIAKLSNETEVKIDEDYG